jgi:hypothetical protein
MHPFLRNAMVHGDNPSRSPLITQGPAYAAEPSTMLDCGERCAASPPRSRLALIVADLAGSSSWINRDEQGMGKVARQPEKASLTHHPHAGTRLSIAMERGGRVSGRGEVGIWPCQLALTLPYSFPAPSGRKPESGV